MNTKRIITVLYALLAVFTMALAGNPGEKAKKVTREYTNPITVRDTPDPTVWDGEDGYHYLFYTSSISKGAPLLRSHDMVTWEETNIDPIAPSTRDTLIELMHHYDKNGNAFFAPTVFRVKEGQWNLYLSLTYRAMVVLTSNSPTGPFHFNGKPYILIDNQITGLDITNEDSWVTRDEKGTLHLAWGSHGCIYTCLLTPDGLRLAPNTKFNILVGLDANKKSNIWDYTGEGIMLYKRGSWWYAFYSQGLYCDSTYTVYVARSHNVNGPFYDRKGRPTSEVIKVNGHNFCAGELLLSDDGNSRYSGPGHNGEIYTDRKGHTYIYYARWDKVKKIRNLWLQRLYWDKEGWPYLTNGHPQYHCAWPDF